MERSDDRSQDQRKNDPQYIVRSQGSCDDADAKTGRLQCVTSHHDGGHHVRCAPLIGAKHQAGPDQLQHHDDRTSDKTADRRRNPVRETMFPAMRMHMKFHTHLLKCDDSKHVAASRTLPWQKLPRYTANFSVEQIQRHASRQDARISAT